MTGEHFANLMRDTFYSCMEVAEKKNKDYSRGNKDSLDNFKSGAEAIGITPLQSCWLQMNKHYAALTHYAKTGGSFESEPINSRIEDLINYAVFMKALIEDKKPQEKL